MVQKPLLEKTFCDICLRKAEENVNRFSIAPTKNSSAKVILTHALTHTTHSTEKGLNVVDAKNYKVISPKVTIHENR